MQWQDLKTLAWKAAQKAVENDSGDVLGIEFRKIREGAWKVGDVGPNAAPTDTTAREAALSLSGLVEKKMMEILRPLPDAEFQAKMNDLAEELS